MLQDWIHLNKKLRDSYFKAKLSKGPCSSLRDQRPEDFEDFVALFKLHNDAFEKLDGMIDLCIVQNSVWKNLEVNIVKEDGSLMDISYRRGYGGGSKQTTNRNNLKRAFRQAVEPQIIQFAQTCPPRCKYCGARGKLQIDHKIPIRKLIDDFSAGRSYIPIEFADAPGNNPCFRPQDAGFEQEWQEYHKRRAVLQPLCRACNLKKG